MKVDVIAIDSAHGHSQRVMTEDGPAGNSLDSNELNAFDCVDLFCSALPCRRRGYLTVKSSLHLN